MFLIGFNSSFPLRKKREINQIKQESQKTEIWSLKTVLLEDYLELQHWI